MTVTQKPNISGGNYKAIDTKDGWFILRDMPCMSLVPKGIKNAPKDIGEEWMGDAVKFHQELYEKGKAAYPIHIGHNDDLGITHPEFVGFFKPTRVGKGLVEGKEQPVTFCDWKIKKTAFERFSKGELPFVSPEIRRWDKHKISSLALLDSQPPHFAFPLQTVGEVVEDPTAKFSADLPEEFKVERFSDIMERVTFDPSVDEKKEEPKKSEDKPMADVKPTEDLQAGKPNAAPVDQKTKEPASVAGTGGKMSLDDPVVAAKFAAIEDRNAALEKRLNERDAADKAKSLADKALESLRGYQIGDKAKAQIAKFAADGEEKLPTFRLPILRLPSSRRWVRISSRRLLASPQSIAPSRRIPQVVGCRSRKSSTSSSRWTALRTPKALTGASTSESRTRR
jgi:hypothetical protein